MKILLIVFILLHVANTAFGQRYEFSDTSNIKTKSIQIELLGNGIGYSFAYENIFINHAKFKTAALIGIEYLPPSFDVDLIFPVQVCQLFSFNKHHLELGIGYSFILELWHEENIKQLSGLFNGRIGYRYQKPDGKFLFRFGFIPFRTHWITNGNEHYKFSPWGGISFGYAFGR
jgi:hypothetical protein